MNNIFGFIDYRSRNLIKDIDDSSVLFNLQNMQLYMSSENQKSKNQIFNFKNLTLVFNGAIYNKNRLEKKLLQYGYQCKDKSDVEILAYLISQYGLAKAVQEVEGVFSFVLFDQNLQKLYLVRDRVGIKSLYYYKIDDLLLFSTKMKFFKKFKEFNKSIDTNALALYFQYRYIPQPYTIFENTYKLKSGHFLEIDLKSKSFEEHKYWDIVNLYNQPKLILSENEILLKIEELVKSSLDKRIQQNSNVGTFLSGGYDSSTIAYFLQKNSHKKIKTYTVGFRENGFDEAPYAKGIAGYLDTDHTEYYLSHNDVLDTLPDFYDIYEEPFGDSAAIPTIIINQLASNNIQALFGGEGGDEIFASSSAVKRYSLINNLPLTLKKAAAFMMKNLHPENIFHLNPHYEFISRYDKWYHMLQSNSVEESIKFKDMYMTKNQVSKLLKKDFIKLDTDFDNNGFLKDSHYLDKIFPVILKTFVSNALLYKVENAASYYNVDNKEPFLDIPFIEFMSRIDPALKYKNGIKKYLQKELIHKYIPNELMDRPKRGFKVPITCWIHDKLKDLVFDYLDEGRIKQENILNVDEIRNIKNSFFNTNNVHDSQVIWNLMMFEIWYEKWMK